MEYRVKFVPDELLNGKVWAICRDPEVTTLYLAASSTEMAVVDKERHLEEAWEGYRLMTSVPEQRRSVNS